MLLDGTDIVDFYQHGTGAGSLGTSLGVDAIAEFQTLTNTYGAQFGGNGGVVNAVTKSGTNSFHGTAFEFLRNSDLDARNFYDGSTIPSFRRNQYGGSIGGPIKKNKAFFFFNYEGLRQSLGVTAIALVPDANARLGIYKGVTYPLTQLQQQLLALYPATTLTSASGIVSVPQVASQVGSEGYFLGRFDYAFSDKDSLFFRAVSDSGNLTNPFAAGYPVPQWPDLEKSPNLYFTAEERHIFSATIINLARASITRTDASAITTAGNPILNWNPANENVPGAQNGILAVTGLSTIGADGNDPFRTLQYKYTLYDDVFWTKGAHSIKFGLSVQRMQSLFYLPNAVFGTYTFNSLQLFLQGQAFTYRGTLPGSTNSYHWFREYPITPYFNDDWKIRPNLTVNLGLRYSYDTNSTNLHDGIYDLTNPPYSTGYTAITQVFAHNPNTKNWDPRIGIAYDPFKDHKTSIRAGFGIFHAVVAPRDFVGTFATQDPLFQVTITNPPFPGPFGNGATVPPPSTGAATYYGATTAPYNMQYNLSIQREIVPDTVLTVTYVGNDGRHEWARRDYNPVIPVVNGSGQLQFAKNVNGSPVANSRVNPNFTYLNLQNSEGNSSYNALQANPCTGSPITFRPRQRIRGLTASTPIQARRALSWGPRRKTRTMSPGIAAQANMTCARICA